MLKSLETQQAKFPQIGILHKGSPKIDGKVGKDLDHFRLDASAEIVDLFVQLFGDRPREIPIYLRTETALASFEAWNEEYDSTGIKLRCDGEYLFGARVKDPNKPTHDGKWYDYTEYDERPCRKEHKCGCSPVGRFRFIIQPFLDAGHVGEVLFSFTSIQDIGEIYANLKAFDDLGGDARRGRFVLRREERVITTTDHKGKRRKQNKWMCSVAPEPQWIATQRAQMLFDYQPPTEALPAPVELLPAEVESQESVEQVEAELVEEPVEEIPTTNDIRKEVGAHIGRVGWSKKRGQDHIKEKYGTTDSRELSRDQLIELRDYLRSLPSPSQQEPEF